MSKLSAIVNIVDKILTHTQRFAAMGQKRVQDRAVMNFQRKTFEKQSGLQERQFQLGKMIQMQQYREKDEKNQWKSKFMNFMARGV